MILCIATSSGDTAGPARVTLPRFIKVPPTSKRGAPKNSRNTSLRANKFDATSSLSLSHSLSTTLWSRDTTELSRDIPLNNQLHGVKISSKERLTPAAPSIRPVRKSGLYGPTAWAGDYTVRAPPVPSAYETSRYKPGGLSFSRDLDVLELPINVLLSRFINNLSRSPDDFVPERERRADRTRTRPRRRRSACLRPRWSDETTRCPLVLTAPTVGAGMSSVYPEHASSKFFPAASSVLLLQLSRLCSKIETYTLTVKRCRLRKTQSKCCSYAALSRPRRAPADARAGPGRRFGCTLLLP
ncbi:hypothetical protein EVAR_41853_1 [Eumeta japonica]|uniref:Uncharacterized protein n=1 Tax=Eumeta variegata TaxID=151549 RepID=A0A4C1XAG7_EUMVA|nr:hypothetical protein EVAR_41853_1 [Eumeta japonica]